MIVMKNIPNYGFPIFDILILMLIGILVVIFISFLVLINIYLIFVLSSTFIIIPLYFVLVISVKKRFFEKRNSLLNKMIDLAGLTGKEIVLDLGTGSGPLAIGFAKHINEGKVYGLDRFNTCKKNIFRQIIEMLKINYFGNNLRNALMNAKIENVEDRCVFISGDLTRSFDFPDCFFDVIVSSQVLPFISNQGQHDIFKEIDRVLKNGGKIIFFEPKLSRKWDIANVKEFFNNIKYDVEIIPIKEFIRSCIFFGKKF